MSSITPSKLIRSRTSRRYVTLRTTLFFVAAFHTALKDGAADEILDSLRSSFDKAAQAFTQARTLIPADQPAETFLHNAKPEAVTAWQALDGHLAGLDRIGAIGAAFGPRTGNFPLIDEYTLGDGFRLEDRALFCTNGPNLEADSAAFRRPGTHRTSPWFRLPVRLHTVDSARDRYREWVSGQWERQHAGPVASVLDANGQMHELPRPKNPYRAKAPVT